MDYSNIDSYNCNCETETRRNEGCCSCKQKKEHKHCNKCQSLNSSCNEYTTQENLYNSCYSTCKQDCSCSEKTNCKKCKEKCSCRVIKDNSKIKIYFFEK